jgi:hypothetical protein
VLYVVNTNGFGSPSELGTLNVATGAYTPFTALPTEIDAVAGMAP